MIRIDRPLVAGRAGLFAVALVAVAAAACGGAPAPPPAAVDEACETTPCISDRWDEPPPQIGQTPPDEPAPDDALEAFEPADDLP